MSAALALICLAAAALASSSEAAKYFKDGKKAEKSGDMAQAYLLYSRAAALAPEKRAYWLKSQAVRSRAALQAKATPPVFPLDVELDSGPGGEPVPDKLVPVSEGDFREGRKPQPPKELKATSGRRDFNLKGDAKQLFEDVSKAFGLGVVFDGEFDAGKTRAFRIDRADYREALYALQSATGSFVVPLGDRLFMAVKDTAQKRTDVEPAVTVIIPIPSPFTIQEAQELARTVQQLMEIKRFGIDSQRRLVIINDRISKVRPAQAVFEDLLYHKAQVRVDVEFLEISRTDLLDLGLTLPTTFPVINLSSILPLFQSATTVPSGLGALLRFGGGGSVFGIGIASSTVIANASKSLASTILRTTMRAVDGLPSTFHVGDKYPILSGGYFGPASFSGPGAYRPPPQFNFEDLGLVVKITPRVHGLEDISIDLEAEFKVLGGQALNGIPIISNRKLTTKLRLKDNEWGIVAGLMTASEARNIQGIAGLSRIPGLGPLFRQYTRNKDGNEVIILLKPQLMSVPPDEEVTRKIWVGTDTRMILPL